MVVPALNEEENILLTVNEILPAARAILDEFEIILVNDGSTDRTGEVMDNLARDNPEIRVIHHSQRQGPGSDFWDGLVQARFDNLVSLSGDNAYKIEGLKRLFETRGIPTQ